MREGNIFSLFTHAAGEGYPVPGVDGGGGGTPYQVWIVGVLHPRSGWEVPHPADGGGTTISGLDEGSTPILLRGSGQGLPWSTLLPLRLDGITPPPPLALCPSPSLSPVRPPAPIRRQISIGSTCYVAGGMPLAFMQEDFLVFFKFANLKPHWIYALGTPKMLHYLVIYTLGLSFYSSQVP